MDRWGNHAGRLGGRTAGGTRERGLAGGTEGGHDLVPAYNLNSKNPISF